MNKLDENWLGTRLGTPAPTRKLISGLVDIALGPNDSQRRAGNGLHGEGVASIPRLFSATLWRCRPLTQDGRGRSS